MRHVFLATATAFALVALVRADEEKVPLDKVPKAILEKIGRAHV